MSVAGNDQTVLDNYLQKECLNKQTLVLWLMSGEGVMASQYTTCSK